MMNLFKRVCSIVLVVALIVTVFAVAIYTGTSAEGGSGTGKTEPKYGLSIENKAITENDTATVKISLDGEDVCGLQFELKYDNSAISLSNMKFLGDDEDYNIVWNSEYTDKSVAVAVYSKKALSVGAVLSVDVTAKDISGEQLYSPLELQNVVLCDSAFNRIDNEDNKEIKLTNGEVRVFPTGTAKLLFVSNSLSLSNAVSMLTKIPNAINTDYSDIYLSYEYENSPIYNGERKVYATKVNGQIKTSTVDISKSERIECMEFEFSNIRPDHYARNIKIVIHAKLNGYDYCSTPLDYSVVQYCINTFNRDSSSDKMKTLCAYILKYGAATQEYVKEKYPELDIGVLCTEIESVKSGIEKYGNRFNDSDIDYNNISKEEMLIIDDKDDESKIDKTISIGISLVLESEISYRFRFMMPEGYDINNIKVKIFNEDENLKKSLTGSQILKVNPDSEDDKWYYVDCPGYNPASLTLPIYFRLYDKDDNPISYKVKYSVGTYAYNKKGEDTLGKLCSAIMKYGLATAEYTK